MKAKLIEKFVSIYGEGGEIRSFFSPGRVNLIGEHTDYNGGHVFPCALSIGTYMIVRKREDRTIRFYSENFSKLGVIETSLDDLVYSEKAGWTNYPKGVMWAIEGRGYKIPTGMDILIYGTIPNGSGLSSSASLEVLTGLAVRDLFGFEGISMIDLALIGQYSENNFNGCNCGIMDQFAVAMGKKDLPSTRQNNFGEDEEKGFTVLYSDTSFEFVKAQFVPYKEIKVDVLKTSKEEILKLAKTNTDGVNVRITLVGDQQAVKAVNKKVFTEHGISVKAKYTDVEVTEAEEAEVVQELSGTDIAEKFKAFCDEKGYEYDEGYKLLKEVMQWQE